MTLREWLHAGDRRNFNPWSAARVVNGAVYIADCSAIEHHRTAAFSLTDYVVSSVSGGSLVFVRRTDDAVPPRIVQCADCGLMHDGDEMPSHECPQQRRANRTKR